jgi:16S rRNA pseudouridine516 synthase
MNLIRIDKILSHMGVASRKTSSDAAKHGKITVDGVTIKSADVRVDPAASTLVFCGEKVEYSEFTYILLNKPAGYLSVTEDNLKGEPTVFDLLPEKFGASGMNLFPCGRLDKNTEGLLILTNDGVTAHRLLSPRSHVEKTYRFTAAHALSQSDITALENGVTLENGYVTLPSRVIMSGDNNVGMNATVGDIAITEGKFHQIKRMFEAVGNRITYLKRIKFGCVDLDLSLEPGGWRYLTEQEKSVFNIA